MSTLESAIVALGLFAVASGAAAVLLFRGRARVSGSALRPPVPAPTAEVTPLNDPRTIRVGDSVEHLGRRFSVRGTLRLREGGVTWSEHFLDDSGTTKSWLSVEEDPDLEVVLWSEYDLAGYDIDAATVTDQDVTYTREKHGTAAYDSEGSTFVANSGRVEYVEFRGPDGRHLIFESYSDNFWECAVGQRVPVTALTVHSAV